MLIHRVAASGRAVAILTEARRAIEVDHPCIVRVKSAEAAGAEILVATDYVDGEPYPMLLAAAREHSRPVTLKVTLRIVCDVLAGLAAMHGGTGGARHERLIFGHLGPDDVLVGADGLTRLAIAARQIRAESAIGYLAPEIALGGDADADERSDVFAVGVFLWEALAQQRLFDETTLDGLVAAQLRGGIPVPPLPDDAPWADGVLDVAMRALAPDPGDRYVGAGAMLESLLEAAGRRVGTAGDIVELVESLVGPYIRARRREASMPNTASNSDIRATSPDREDETLRPINDEPEIVTAVDFHGMVRREADTTTVPRIHPDDVDDLKTEIQQDLLHALPTVAVRAVQAETKRRPSFAEDPSITSTLPPEVKRELIAKQRQLGEDAPTITKVAGETGLPHPFPERELEKQKEDQSISVSVPGQPIRRHADSIVTLDLPPDREASIVTARRVAPTMQSLGVQRPSTAANEEVEELLAETASLDRSAMPKGPPLILEETVNMDQGGEIRRAVSTIDATLDMRKAQQAAIFGQRTMPLAVPLQTLDHAQAHQQMAMASPQPPQVAHSPYPPMAVALPPPSGPHLPPIAFPPAPMAPRPSRWTITDEAPRSSAMLGVFTFFLVLASLLVLAWLTFPYWRAWAGL